MCSVWLWYVWLWVPWTRYTTLMVRRFSCSCWAHGHCKQIYRCFSTTLQHFQCTVHSLLVPFATSYDYWVIQTMTGDWVNWKPCLLLLRLVQYMSCWQSSQVEVWCLQWSAKIFLVVFLVGLTLAVLSREWIPQSSWLVWYHPLLLFFCGEGRVTRRFFPQFSTFCGFHS